MESQPLVQTTWNSTEVGQPWLATLLREEISRDQSSARNVLQIEMRREEGRQKNLKRSTYTIAQLHADQLHILSEVEGIRGGISVVGYSALPTLQEDLRARAERRYTDGKVDWDKIEMISWLTDAVERKDLIPERVRFGKKVVPNVSIWSVLKSALERGHGKEITQLTDETRRLNAERADKNSVFLYQRSGDQVVLIRKGKSLTSTPPAVEVFGSTSKALGVVGD